MLTVARRFRLSALTVVAMLVAVSACGSDDSADAGGGDSGGPTVEILQPADGDTIGLPFTLVVDSSEELGPTESGNHHVHIFFDGDDTYYEVIEDNNAVEREITAESPALTAGLAPGEHTLNISLRNADHSAAGAEAEVTVTVEG